MRDNAIVERICFSFSFGRSNWNCVKGTNDVLSGVHVPRWCLDALFFTRRGQPQHKFTTTFCVATRMRTWRLLSKKRLVCGFPLLVRVGWHVGV